MCLFHSSICQRQDRTWYLSRVAWASWWLDSLFTSTYFQWSRSWLCSLSPCTQLECVVRLVQMGCEVNTVTSRFNQTPTHTAAFGGHPHCVVWLTQAGADVNRQVSLHVTRRYRPSAIILNLETGIFDIWWTSVKGSTQSPTGLGMTCLSPDSMCYIDQWKKLNHLQLQFIMSHIFFVEIWVISPKSKKIITILRWKYFSPMPSLVWKYEMVLSSV